MEHDKIPELYQIAADRSLDLNTANKQNKTVIRTVANYPSTDPNI